MTIVVSGDSNVNFQSFAGLKSSIAARLDRDFEDGDLNDFVYLAERELERVLTVPYREAVTALTINAQAINTPIDFKSVRMITLDGSPVVVLQQVTPAVLTSDYPFTGSPVAYSLIADQIWFGPVPDGSYTAQLVYEQRIAPLTPTNPSNWLLDLHPDLYFYGALVQATDFIADTNRIALYRAAFDNAVEQVNAEGLRYRASAAPLRLRNPVRVV